MNFGKPANLFEALSSVFGNEYRADVTEEEYNLRLTEQPQRERAIVERYERGEIDSKTMWRERDALEKEISERVKAARASDAPTTRRTNESFRI